jgi:stage V sporulation protein SpoVS
MESAALPSVTITVPLGVEIGQDSWGARADASSPLHIRRAEAGMKILAAIKPLSCPHRLATSALAPDHCPAQRSGTGRRDDPCHRGGGQRHSGGAGASWRCSGLRRVGGAVGATSTIPGRGAAVQPIGALGLCGHGRGLAPMRRRMVSPSGLDAFVVPALTGWVIYAAVQTGAGC